jgi:hypothetical protein
MRSLVEDRDTRQRKGGRAKETGVTLCGLTQRQHKSDQRILREACGIDEGRSSS